MSKLALNGTLHFFCFKHSKKCKWRLFSTLKKMYLILTMIYKLIKKKKILHRLTINITFVIKYWVFPLHIFDKIQLSKYTNIKKHERNYIKP